ncbi:MAG: hypothetical protein A2099_06790 [Planctomycetes bacterium GWF2_39_10]|nr:MAG: hypothetical protein A2Y09_00370 [Planctomycetes bacterium GWA2_39_15]OHB48273.1 MAG: hypothetical protein A2099_06790 [Planctomycetes bacterium GWF2_39_10]
MRDSYFTKSLFSTLLCYLVLSSILMIFVVVTGIVGALFIFMMVVLLLVYFYGGFKKLRIWEAKGKRFD